MDVCLLEARVISELVEHVVLCTVQNVDCSRLNDQSRIIRKPYTFVSIPLYLTIVVVVVRGSEPVMIGNSHSKQRSTYGHISSMNTGPSSTGTVLEVKLSVHLFPSMKHA